MNRPHVVVGIATYNRAEIVPKAIESALAQSYPSLDVAVVDDASTDTTPSLAAQFPLIEFTRWTSNRGYGPARNHLMLNADADYYVSLDDDAWFLRDDEIALAVDFLEKHRDIGAVAFDILSPDRPTAVERRSPMPAATFIGCGHVLRLDAIRRLNGYASFPGNYGCEETDLCLRLLDAGYRIVKLPGVHVWHDKTTTERDLVAQHRSGVCNDLAVTLRRTPLGLLPAAISWKLMQHIVFAAKARLLPSCLAGMWIVLGSLPAIWRDRRPVGPGTLRRFAKLSRV